MSTAIDMDAFDKLNEQLFDGHVTRMDYMSQALCLGVHVISIAVAIRLAERLQSLKTNAVMEQPS